MTAVDDPAAAILRGRVRAAVEVLQACGAEVVEQYGVEWAWPDGDVTTGWYADHAEAEAERDLPHHAESATLVRRLRLVLPAETVEE